MRVIICGAGQVGYNIAAYLSKEENEVTVVDTDPQLIAHINENLDVKGVQGHASNPDVLNGAGANDADMIIAVTHSDEVNMVACQIGHSLFGIPKKIARIRAQSYLKPEWANLFSRTHMPIDVIISPEVVIAREIYQRLAVPGTTFVASLADGLAHLIGVICQEDCPVINTPLNQLDTLFPDLSFRIIAIMRKNKPIIPDEQEQLLEGDEVFFTVDAKHLKRMMTAFGNEESEARRITIVGGGNIGFGLAQMLMKKGRGVQLKMIERDEKRAQYLSDNLEGAIIMNGDALKKGLLQEAAIEQTETFVAVTNDDESNILGSLLAKQLGGKRVVTLVNNESYNSLVSPLGIDTIVSPRATIVANIMQHVRRGRIKGIYNLRDGFAEIIEAEVSDNVSIVNMPVEEVEVPHEIIVSAIIRDEEVIIPTSDEIIKVDDRVIILAAEDRVNEVERMFSVQVDLF